MGETTVQLSEALLAKLAGWEAMKHARGLAGAGAVTDAVWEPPALRGLVREGGGSYKAGLIINSDTDAENLCSCRISRQRGLICAHSVAVGLAVLSPQPAPIKTQNAEADSPAKKEPPAKPEGKRLRRALESGEGEPLEISVVLPPNLAEAISKGRIMLFAEGKWRKGRMPLAALPLDESFRVDAADGVLLDALEKINGGETPATLMLAPAQFASVLPALAGHPRVSLGKSQNLQVATDPLRLPVSAELETSGEITVRLKGPQPKAIIDANDGWIFDGAVVRRAVLPPGLGDILKGPMRISREHVPFFLSAAWPRLNADCDVSANFALDDFILEPGIPAFKLRLDGGLAFLNATLECLYEGKSVSLSNIQSSWMPDPRSPARYRTRDIAAERAAVARLAKRGFAGPGENQTFRLEGENAVLNFFAREYPRLQREWEITLEQRLERSAQKLEFVEPSFQITSSGESWFDMGVSYGTPSGAQLSQADIQRLLLSGQSHTRLKDGRIGLVNSEALEEFQETLRDCAPQQHSQGYRIGNAQAGFIDATLRQQTGWRVNAPGDWKDRAAKQSAQTEIKPPSLGDLENVLRPYQKQGVGWMGFLRANGFGGILADEMGLGKTLQVLAHLSVLKSIAEPAGETRTAPNLVVCPTSLVFNWASEAAKFTPNLRVLALHGPQRRSLFANIPSADIVITSYALLRRDAEHYQPLEFDTVILDEAQHIKNRQTQNAQAVKAIRSRHRLVLTGTPLENSVLDLWSIFDFLMPGYLGAAADFRERYELPIAQNKDTAAQARLARRVRPFLLRRLKREVAPDLPARIEQTSFCELNDEQRGLYQQILEAGRNEILQAGAQSLAKSRMVVLTTLLRLRQICCDPRLLKINRGSDQSKNESAAVAVSSGKMELFRELLEEVLDGGHRVLVFSQFTSMLDLIRKELQAQEIEFCYLDGSTPNRRDVVETFQREGRIPVFLISLKAGGVGLNLTGADTVIHFDPWWNPAVEAQATDRAHRIGQTKVVTSYKLITRGTVEEKILSLQTRKRAVIQAALGDEEELAQTLSWDEIQELLGQ
jgi:superfamily II DNA or RNA helicase